MTDKLPPRAAAEVFLTRYKNHNEKSPVNVGEAIVVIHDLLIYYNELWNKNKRLANGLEDLVYKLKYENGSLIEAAERAEGIWKDTKP